MYAHPIPAPLALLSLALATLLLMDAMRRARWQARLAEHAGWALATAAAVLAHQTGLTLPSGLTLHYVGAAFLALLLGYPRALLSMAVVLFGGPLLDDGPAGQRVDDTMLALQWLVGGWLPVWTIATLTNVSKRLLPRNPFVFMIGCGLFGQFIAYALHWLVSAAILAATAPTLPHDFLDTYLPYAILLASGEAWVEAMLLSALVVVWPDAVRLFDQRHHLPGG